VDVVVSESFLKINDITLNNAANCRSLRQPHRQALTNFLRNGENAEFLAELPVITLFSLLKYLQIIIELTLFSKCGPINALQLFVVAISPPIGAGNAQEFESLDFTCRRYMNPAAQIIKLTLLIDGHLLVFSNVIKQFQLQRIVLKHVLCFLTRNLDTFYIKIFIDNTLHFFFNFWQILRC